jgi:hypothetical protein
MRPLVIFLALLTAFVWFLSQQNDCDFQGMSAEQWLACATGRTHLDEAVTKLEGAVSLP